MFDKLKNGVRNLANKADAVAIATGAILANGINTFASEGDGTAEVASQITAQFTSAAGELKTVLLSVIGISMGVILVKIVFKNGVSFFKQGTSK